MITYIERHFGNYDPPTAEVYFNCGKNLFYKKNWKPGTAQNSY